jgi:hypothetical protein
MTTLTDFGGVANLSERIYSYAGSTLTAAQRLVLTFDM